MQKLHHMTNQSDDPLANNSINSYRVNLSFMRCTNANNLPHPSDASFKMLTDSCIEEPAISAWYF